MASNKNQQPKKAPSASQSGKNEQKGRRRRRARGGKNNKNKNQKNQNNNRRRNGSNFQSSDVPWSVAYANRAFVNPKPTQIRDRRWGDGVSLPFSQLITTVADPGFAGPFDELIPFNVSQITAGALVASGVTDTTSTNCTGILCHPVMLGGRFISETNNWTRYRFRKLCASFVPFSGTNTAGAIILHLNGDSNKWPEVEDVKSALVPSITNLTSARPMVEGPVWMEQDVCVNFTGQETWPCELTSDAYGTGSAIFGSLAYIREAYQYRLAGLLENTVPANYGRLYLSGIIEFFQPSYGNISGVGLTEAPTSSLLSSTSAPEMKSKLMGAWTSSLKFGSKEPIESKMFNPDDPIIIPPAPKLVRTSAIDHFSLVSGKSSSNKGTSKST